MSEVPIVDLPEPQKLSSMATHLLEECRMVLPGVQALFGFQLIAVFNQTFWERLSASHRLVHLVALFVIAIAISLVMAPAAYHRLTHLETISRRFIVISSRLLLVSMFPLIVGICLDFFLIADLIVENDALSIGLAITLFLAYVIPWFIVPLVYHRGGHAAASVSRPSPSASRRVV